MKFKKYRNFFWKIREFFWVVCGRIKRVFRFARKIQKYPHHEIWGGKWDNFSHHHICIVLRLLENKDFEEVCPSYSKLSKSKDFECDVVCDYCPYMEVIEFNTTEDGRKEIKIF